MCTNLLEDIILVSSSEKISEWIEEGETKYGVYCFTGHIVISKGIYFSLSWNSV